MSAKLSERSAWQGLKDALCNPEIPFEMINFVVGPLLEKYALIRPTDNIAPILL